MTFYSYHKKGYVHFDCDTEKVQLYDYNHNFLAELNISGDSTILHHDGKAFVISESKVLTCINLLDSKILWIKSHWSDITKLIFKKDKMYIIYDGCDVDECLMATGKRVNGYKNLGFECIEKYGDKFYVYNDGRISILDDKFNQLEEICLKKTIEGVVSFAKCNGMYHIAASDYGKYYTFDEKGNFHGLTKDREGILEHYLYCKDIIVVKKDRIESKKFGTFTGINISNVHGHGIFKIENIYRLMIYPSRTSDHSSVKTIDIEVFKRTFANFRYFSKKTRKLIVFLKWVLDKIIVKDIIERIIMLSF